VSVERALAQKLRQTQADLAASQADLTSVERERDEAAALNRQLAEQLDWQREVVAMLRKNEEVRAQVIRKRNRERDLLRAELASARQELERHRRVPITAWAVADRYTHDCTTCHWAIDVGQAYRPLPGADGLFAHVICPRLVPASDHAGRRPFHDVPVPEADRPAMEWLEQQRHHSASQRTTAEVQRDTDAPQTRGADQ
jgi:hypothetical protein